MKTENDRPPTYDGEEDMLPEYDFTGKSGVRGKYVRAFREGYTVTVHHPDGTSTTRYEPEAEAIVLDPDVRAYFPDSETVNRTLRSLIALLPKKE